MRKCRRLSGSFTFGGSVGLQSGLDADRLPMKQLRDHLSDLCVRARIALSARIAEVGIVGDPCISGDEAYRLTIRPYVIEILSSAAAGAYYAIQTLRELLTIHGKTTPAMQIDDAPNLARRGVYHDCSRGKVPKIKTLRALIERLARWKINELQLYVENTFTFAGHPDIGRGYSPFTPDDILAIQDHCKKHHIRLVGSLTSFGHMEKILMLPKYRHLAELPGHNGWPGGTTLCPSDPGSIKLLRDMYAEFLPLFEADDFNVCCDEPWELGKGRSKNRAEKIGVGRVYLDFILKIHKLCRKYGKRMNMWADIVLEHPEIIPLIPKDIVMLNWDYDLDGKRIRRTKEITDAGLSVVCCPGTHGWQSHGSGLAVSMVNVAAFARTARRNGAEGFLNTDWGDFG
ncbi:MAG: family 20 glycosylhydrolase, partial [Phycisphaerae bacterium]|nr:family 20 glycosylhydrolase [Phycisphaerae bacterium]